MNAFAAGMAVTREGSDQRGNGVLPEKQGLHSSQSCHAACSMPALAASKAEAADMEIGRAPQRCRFCDQDALGHSYWMHFPRQTGVRFAGKGSGGAI
ncbi:hypothetical protein Nham_3489 [Nitrobacter hamburgensis X14]|uniref:Uncharacterized protein n=1 Tax=Nitrobacter hamburgensis (strain DSM 10229 / NCIMB 13809 / X14) TaxID=323097 RepID=Q1QHS9_NITHX|nr:hypothetical protein Nham_3489 [Nitrobacter hamburgensis X14]